MHAIVGPILLKEGCYAFDLWTAEEGLSRGYAYRRVEDAHYARNVARGEVTVVVAPPEQEDDPEDLDERLRAALAGNSVKDAAALVAVATGLPRKLVYGRALALSR